MVDRQPDALIVLQDALTLQHRKEIIDFTVQKQLPGMFVAREWVTAGGLMSYGENLAAMDRRGVYFVDKILKGAKPADLPVEQVTKFELIVNLKTAKVMGWIIPPEILATADDVIEYSQVRLGLRKWHAASFHCDAGFDRYRSMADIDQATPTKLNS